MGVCTQLSTLHLHFKGFQMSNIFKRMLQFGRREERKDVNLNHGAETHQQNTRQPKETGQPSCNIIYMYTFFVSFFFFLFSCGLFHGVGTIFCVIPEVRNYVSYYSITMYALIELSIKSIANYIFIQKYSSCQYFSSTLASW